MTRRISTRDNGESGNGDGGADEHGVGGGGEGSVSRRAVLRGAAAGAAVVGALGSAAPVWAAGASSDAGSSGLPGLPPLDGTLLTDPADLAAAAQDFGHIVHRTPRAVLQPGSVHDVTAMLGYCRATGLPVAPRGQGHQTFGQAQVRGGLVIDSAPLHAIEVLGDRVRVQAGTTWDTLLAATLAHGLTPPVFTDYVGLSVGGTLSVGGVGGASQHFGAQVDQVLELEVATGAGQLVRCSPTEHAELFEAALAGLGQYGVITAAVLPLVQAPASVRQYTVTYPTLAALAADQRRVVRDGRFAWLEGTTAATGTAAGDWQYVLEGAVYYTDTPPDDAAVLAGLDYLPGTLQTTDLDYSDFVNDLAATVAYLESTGEWFDPHPWLNLFVPDAVADGFLTEVMGALAPPQLGASGLVLLYPVPRARFTRPLLRVPDAGEMVFLFSILGTAAPDGAGAPPAAVTVEFNRELFHRARALGATQYPVGSIPMSPADWRAQYGPVWPLVQAAKHRYDPAGVLTPGQGIFREPGV